MAQNIDDFFKQKIENIQDTLPENSSFDENLLWAKMQQDLRKPKPIAWIWLAPVAACLVVFLSWWTFTGRGVSHTPVVVEHGKVIKAIAKKNEEVITSQKQEKRQFLKKKTTIQTKKLDFQVESIAIKKVEFSREIAQDLPDSLNFQSTIVFEKKPKVNFKTVHINEISKQGEMPFQQPRFKVQFAGKLFEKTETNYKETIQTPSIRIQ